METPILELFSPMVLMAIGIALIAIEALLFSFFIFWFGVAAIIVGIASYFVPYTDGLWQLATVAILAMILLLTLRSKALKTFMKAKDKEHNDDFFNESGEGEIRDQKVYFKGTYWKINSKDVFENGEKVKVVSVSGATATVKKI